MDCPKCKSSQKKKNGFRRGKQSYKCKNCGTQYVANPSSKAYFRQIEQSERIRVLVSFADTGAKHRY